MSKKQTPILVFGHVERLTWFLSIIRNKSFEVTVPNYLYARQHQQFCVLCYVQSKFSDFHMFISMKEVCIYFCWVTACKLVLANS